MRTPHARRGSTWCNRNSTSLPAFNWWLESMNRRSPGTSDWNKPTSQVWTGWRRERRSSPARLARGSGSIAVMRVPSEPSHTARARKRVEWPEPTSTMRAGRVMRTMAYAAAASRRANQSCSQRGAGGASVPMAMRSGARSSIQPRTRIGDKSGLEDQSLVRHERAGQRLLHFARNGVEHVVVVVRVVVEHHHALRARFLAKADAFLPGGMPPADVAPVFVVGVHAVVDDDVRIRDEREDVAVEAARHVLGVGDIAERAALVVDAIAGRAVGMIERRGAQRHPFASLNGLAGGEIAVLERRAEDFRRHREERRHHELGE